MPAQPDNVLETGPAPAQDAAAWVAPLAVFLSTVAVLVTAFFLSPSKQGIGTHKSLGLPACGLYESTGVPCMTCGMTTAFSYAAGGDLVNAFITQPAGALLAVLTAMAAVVSGYALVSGMLLVPVWNSVWRAKVVVPALVVLVLAWVYKIAAMNGMIGAFG